MYFILLQLLKNVHFYEVNNVFAKKYYLSQESIEHIGQEIKKRYWGIHFL